MIKFIVSRGNAAGGDLSPVNSYIFVIDFSHAHIVLLTTENAEYRRMPTSKARTSIRRLPCHVMLMSGRPLLLRQRFRLQTLGADCIIMQVDLAPVQIHGDGALSKWNQSA